MVEGEADSKMQEAEGPDEEELKEGIQLKDSCWMYSRPIPSGPMTALTREPVFTLKLLAAQGLEDGKV
jgi:hypothetical protein